MKNIDLSIVIVSYNTKSLLVDCILSIINTTKEFSYEIIVVDNASHDDTCDVVRSTFVQRIESLRKKHNNLATITLIKNKENFGFSKANNLGVNKSCGRYVLFLNPDMVVYENTIDSMVSFMDKQKDCGASTCYVSLPDGKLDDASHRGFPNPWNAFCHFTYLSKVFPKIKLFSQYNLTHLDLKQTHEIDACAGAFMLVRRDAGEKMNWWDEDYFWYGEDLDFCYRLKENGWKIFFVPDYRILHYKGASGGIKKTSQHLTIADKGTREKAIDARFNAMKIFYRKHYQNKYPAPLKNLVILGVNTRWTISKFTNRILNSSRQINKKTIKIPIEEKQP